MPDDSIPSPASTSEKPPSRPATQTTQTPASPVSPEALKGYAILGCYLTGIVGILVGLFTGNGLALLASAVSFGVVFHRSVS